MSSENRFVVAVIGAGPAGLMAAETLIRQGVTVQVYEAKPSVGRKFLMAGRGGLNITHSEPTEKFVARYGARAPEIGRMLEQFDAEALRAWVHTLGIETFVGGPYTLGYSRNNKPGEHQKYMIKAMIHATSYAAVVTQS